MHSNNCFYLYNYTLGANYQAVTNNNACLKNRIIGWNVKMLVQRKTMRLADAIGLVTTRLHPCACTYKKLYTVCELQVQSLHWWSVNTSWPKIDLLLCLFISILPRICWITAYILWYTLQYTAFSRCNNIQTCGGITAWLLTTARILTASVLLSIPSVSYSWYCVYSSLPADFRCVLQINACSTSFISPCKPK